MYLKITKTQYKGSEATYAKIVESYRDGGTSRQRIVLNLGRINNKSDLRKYEQILKSLKQDKEFIDISQLSVENCYEYGVTYLTNSIFEKFGLDKIIKKYVCANGSKFDVYGILKALIVNRLIKPSSELSAMDWVDKHYYERLAIKIHYFYRSLDYLISHKESIETDIFQILKKKLRLDTSQIFYDLTSTYFEGQKCKIALFGHSRDHRPDRKQVVIGLAMCDTIPVMHEVYEGNTVDKSTFCSIEEKITERLGIKKAIFLGDGGLMTDKNILYLESANKGYILACNRRNNNYAKEWLIKEVNSDDNQFAIEVHKERFQVGKEKRFRRFILCLDNKTRKIRLEELERIKKDVREKLSILQRRYKKSQNRKKGKKITKESLILQANKILGKNKRIFSLDYSNGLEFKVNKKAWNYEQKIAGKFLLITNTDMEANKAMQEYKQLQKVENAFDDLKNFLDIRPIYHWKSRRVKAHIFVCCLSFLVESIIEKFTQQTASSAINELQTLKIIYLKVGKNEIKRISKISDDNLKIFGKLKIQVPY